MKTILVAGSKGGVGKTTVATHLAAHSALQGRRTVLADADPQGSATRWAERRAELDSAVLPLDASRRRAWRAWLPEDAEQVVIDAPAGALAALPSSGRGIVLLKPAERDLIARYRAAGFHGYLIKPLRRASLAERVLAAIGAEAPDKASTHCAAPIEDDRVARQQGGDDSGPDGGGETGETNGVDKTVRPQQPAGDRRQKGHQRGFKPPQPTIVKLKQIRQIIKQAKSHAQERAGDGEVGKDRQQ